MHAKSNSILFLSGEAHGISTFCLDNTTLHLYWNTDVHTQSINLLNNNVSMTLFCLLFTVVSSFFVHCINDYVDHLLLRVLSGSSKFNAMRFSTPALSNCWVYVHFVLQTTLSGLPNHKILFHIKLHHSTCLCCANNTSFINENIKW